MKDHGKITAGLAALTAAAAFGVSAPAIQAVGSQIWLPRPAATTVEPAVLNLAAAQEAVGAELFRRQCVACHGAKGAGDGPAAPVLTPPPADLTDAKRMGEVIDEDLAKIIADGKGSMPAFSKLLKSAQLDALVRYVRSLSAGEGSAKGDSEER